MLRSSPVPGDGIRHQEQENYVTPIRPADLILFWRISILQMDTVKDLLIAISLCPYAYCRYDILRNNVERFVPVWLVIFNNYVGTENAMWLCETSAFDRIREFALAAISSTVPAPAYGLTISIPSRKATRCEVQRGVGRRREEGLSSAKSWVGGCSR